VGLLRDILIGKVQPPAQPTEETRLGEGVTQEKLLVLLDHFGEAEGRLRWATDKKLQLDVALIKGIHLLGEASLSDVLDALSALRGGAPLPERAAPRPTLVRPPAPTVAAAPAPKATPLPSTATAPVPAKVEQVAPAPVAEVPTQVEIPPKAEDLAEPVSASAPPAPPAPLAESPSPAAPAASDPWSVVANQLSTDSPLKFGWTEDGKFIERIGNAVLVEFPPSMEHQTKTLFWPQAIKKIEEQLSTLIGGRITFEYRFTGEEPPAPPEPEPVAAPQPRSVPSASKPKAGEPAKAPEPVAPAISAEELEAFKNDPLIKKALEMFKAEILIDPPKPA